MIQLFKMSDIFYGSVKNLSYDYQKVNTKLVEATKKMLKNAKGLK